VIADISAAEELFHSYLVPQGAFAECAKPVREVRDNMADALDQSVKRRPYTTLLLAVGLGFLLGAAWAR
jgi:ElaB/YqjD/DUF883 family membrane-anchored ribosome-binding protein